jgi:hypothetical protein
MSIKLQRTKNVLKVPALMTLADGASLSDGDRLKFRATDGKVYAVFKYTFPWAHRTRSRRPLAPSAGDRRRAHSRPAAVPRSPTPHVTGASARCFRIDATPID